MPIADVVSISISVSAAGPVGAGFGEPMIAAYHTHYTDRVREYSSLVGMVADGFLVTDLPYLAAAEVFAQTPTVPFLKIGRRATPLAQVINLLCLSTSNLDTYSFQLRTPGGSWQSVVVASTGTTATDVATINTAVTALALTGLTATHTGSTLVLTMATGHFIDVQTDFVHMTLADATADGGAALAADLAAILAADNAWYGLLLDTQSPAEITEASAFAEANKKLFVWNCSDTAIANAASTTDIAYNMKTLAYARSAGLFAQTQLLCFSSAAWMGRLFPSVAGTENWAFKTLVGVPADKLTDTQVHAVENKNCSVYTTLFSVNITQFGKQPGGEWIDITRGTDNMTNDMQLAIFGLQANSLRVPYTDAGIDMYRSEITGVLVAYVDRGFLADTPPFYVSLPTAASAGSTQRALRNLPNVSFSAQLAGAINSTSIVGVLNT
jgi:hypothetical protein